MRVRTSIWVGLTMAAFMPFETMAFEKVGIGWCDKMLAEYELCLRGVTYEKCEVIAKRDKLSRTYKQPGPGGSLLRSAHISDPSGKVPCRGSGLDRGDGPERQGHKCSREG